MSTTPSTSDADFGGAPNLEEVRQRIARAWDVVGREPRRQAPPPQDDGWWQEQGRPLVGRAALQVSLAAAATSAAVRGLWDRRTTGDVPTDAPAVDEPAVDGDEAAPGFVRRHPVLVGSAAVLTLFAGAAAAVPLTGHTEEAIAMVGERFFDVAPLPADLSAPNERSRVLDAHGNELAKLSGPENRRLVPLDAIPQVMQDAVIATEDARFWEHDGVDAQGIVRAAVANYRAGEVRQGGSTLTQQYVKNVLLTSERSLERKVTEATWAVRLEEEMSKEEILEGYLNIVYFGGGTYGVGAASEYWFGLPVEQLDLGRAALLASLIAAPSSVDLEDDPESAAPGREAVLREMVNLGMVDGEEAQRANEVPVASLLDITPLPEPDQPMFVRHVVDVLLDSPALGETRKDRAAKVFGGGLTITTTLDSDLQGKAETSLREFVTDPNVDPLAGIVSVVPGNGAVRSMALGPKGWGPCEDLPEGEACTTTTMNPLVAGAGSPGRQVGSSFKPILLAAALEDGIGTDWHTDTRGGEPIAGCPEDWEPENYDEGSAGIIDMPKALTTSNNIYHVKLGAALGMEKVTDVAARLGLPDLPAYCSLPLGSVESHPVTMAAAYAAFAADGLWCQPYAVTEVRDRNGEVLLATQPECEQVLDPEVSRTLTAMLEENVERGTATRAQIGRPAAAKTGTTNDFRDAWLVGFTPQLATAVWVGHEVPQEMRGILGFRVVAGGTVPAQIWGAYMARAMEGLDVVEFADVDLVRWSRGCRDRDDFVEGRQGCAPKPAPAPAPPPAQPQPAPKPPKPPKDDKPDKPKDDGQAEAQATSSPKPAPSPSPEPSSEPSSEPSPEPTPAPTPTPTASEAA